VYEARRGKYIHGKRIFKKREIASLTKIMNLIVVIDTLKRFQLDAKKIKVRVTREAADMSGTTAFLK
jgi:D-alanyl-D-alanine carboxypeptidase